MLFALMCHDKPGHLEVRLANRQAHLDYLGESPVAFAGPLLDDADQPNGSLIVLDLPDRAAAEAWAAADPYAQAGLFDRVAIHAWKRVIG